MIAWIHMAIMHVQVFTDLVEFTDTKTGQRIVLPRVVLVDPVTAETLDIGDPRVIEDDAKLIRYIDLAIATHSN